ncbi:MAG: hypothetical protein WCJ64_00145 [Rhodospirillaceae bacterium]
MTTHNDSKAIKTMDAAITEIAGKVLGLETLATQNRDSLDFHDLSVWQIKKALEAAFQAGAEAARRAG